jgi:phage terminase Nu1 subunit (DNA packaging protein)
VLILRISSREALADLFGVTVKTIAEWQEQGMPIAVRGKPGVASEYDSKACIEWRVQHELEKVKGESPKDRLDRLRGDREELELAEKRGQLVPADQVEPMWDGMVAAARSFLRSEVNRLAQLLEQTSGVEAKRDLIAETFDEFLTKLSGYDPDDTTDRRADPAQAVAALPGPAGAAAADLGRAVG